jgi:hypothetical protein
MTMRELSCDIDNVEEENQNLPNISADIANKKITKQGILQNITSIVGKSVLTSTPKREVPKIIKKRAKEAESMAENKKSKTNNSENKSKGECKKRHKISKKNTKDEQDNNINMIGEEKKTNEKVENNKKNRNSSKNKVKKQCKRTPN